MKELLKVFSEADADQDGKITVEELEAFIHHGVGRHRLKHMGLDFPRARALFKLLDVDDKGVVAYEEFAIGCLRLKGGAKSIDTATLMYENKKMMKAWVKHMAHLDKVLRNIQDRLDEVLVEAESESEASKA